MPGNVLEIDEDSEAEANSASAAAAQNDAFEKLRKLKEERQSPKVDAPMAVEGCLTPLRQVPFLPKSNNAGSSSTTANQPADPSGNAVLDAIAALSKKVDKMALKEDIISMKAELQKDIKKSVSEAVDPLKNAVFELEARVVSLEKVPAQQVQEVPSPHLSKAFSKMQTTLGRLDPNIRRASIIGWPESMTEDERVAAMEKFTRSIFPTMHLPLFGHYHKGKGSDHKLSSVSYIEFTSYQVRKQFVKAAQETKNELKVGGKTLLVKNGRTEIQNDRNGFVREAEEIMKKSELSKDKAVEIDWMVEPRVVKVDGVPVFSQSKTDVVGTFTGNYSDFTLG